MQKGVGHANGLSGLARVEGESGIVMTMGGLGNGTAALLQRPWLRWYLSPYADLYNLMQNGVGHDNGSPGLARVG